MPQPQIIRDPHEIQAAMLALKRQGKTIAVVPTMGALHEGHRTLIAKARKLADILVATIFVNPTQFGPNEDLAKYPRTFDSDLQLCAGEGVDFIFFPASESMYPAGYSTYVNVEGLTRGLCGRSRPTHFRGVATVVCKLFNIVQADFGVFGWKDAQQLLVIQRMARDLNLPMQIIGVETVRESDGLALSSRNKYLTDQERAQAPIVRAALLEAQGLFQQGETDAQAIRRHALHKIEQESAGKVDYIEVVSLDALEPLDQIRPNNTLIAAAVFFGSTRLIDNIRL